ncbi:hypothetical protein BKA62DRAFT_767049 [Auriculariales sp. MPI-PUGE-AT-0066]|nr:hypothetical protein BKA62DRAFT_767049 [Auriculariales sp. MPI-PUGE-AT-0066]
MAASSGRTSPGSTLTASFSGKLAQAFGTLPKPRSPHVHAAALIEQLALKRSSSLFVYDLAEHADFGTSMRTSQQAADEATVVSMQTRPGAGLVLLGRLAEGTSKHGPRGSVITAFTTPTGLEAMAEQLADLPSATATSRLVIQVAAATPVGPSLSISPSLSRLGVPLTYLPDDVAVILSAGAQEAVDIAALSYQLSSQHVVHVFDQHGAARELRKLEAATTSAPVHDTIAHAPLDYFSYHGDPAASCVVVALNGAFASVLASAVARIPGLGLLIVRVLRPWDAEAFALALPRTARSVQIVDESYTSDFPGLLVGPVSGAAAQRQIQALHAHSLSPEALATHSSSASATWKYLEKIVGASFGPSVEPEHLSSSAKKVILYSGASGKDSLLPELIAQDFVGSSSLSARLLVEHDEFAKPGGITVARLHLAQQATPTSDLPLATLIPIEGRTAHFVGVFDDSLVKTHDVFRGAVYGGTVLIRTSWTADELIANIATPGLDILRNQSLHLYTIDAAGIAARHATQNLDVCEIVISHLAFLKLYLGRGGSQEVLQQLAEATFGSNIDNVAVSDLALAVWRDLAEISAPVAVADAPDSTSLSSFNFNTLAVTEDNVSDSLKASAGGAKRAITNLLFPEALRPKAPTTDEEFPQIPTLRPDLPERTFVVTCSVNRRLTPLEYSRNVFHMEFDTSNTGLKYAIGEALGIHGWNDENEIIAFCDWYGVDPNKLISIPVPETNGTVRHVRTVLQALQQQIDLFGRPPKSFYAALSRHAKVKEDRMALHFISSPEGASTFKKLGEKDTVTFADVLQRYKSARPPIADLCEIIGDIKPRHYSIASSQSAVGDRVDLLIVTVEWATPSGSPRFGQCTRYLAGLKAGQKVTVSIKPSVMKLPPNDMQPIIMAGLGTGAAPFRAFMQHRAVLAAQGVPTGPLFYYFGSRHRSEEYLYGEEIEAYLHDNVLTHAGLAFSRDGPRKVYIQHKMQEDAENLAIMLDSDDKGVFYLCGPTWPVPDVYEALVSALVKYKGREREAAGKFLEDLKEEERYVLEVY